MRIGVLACVALVLAACGGSGEFDERSTADVYAAVIRVVVEGNAELGKPLFVEGGRLTPGQQRTIQDQLVDLPWFDFVAEGRSVIVDTDGCPAVRDDGALVLLGPIEGTSERVTVRGDLFLACLGASRAVWILERDGDEWQVTGTDGPIGVS